MSKKIEAALKLIQEGSDQKYFQGLCLLLEVYEEDPASLDPVARVLIERVARPIVSGVEKAMDVKVFHEKVARA